MASQDGMRKKRGPTMLKNHKYNPNLAVEFNHHGLACGENQATFSNWVGREVKSRISIITPEWDKVDDLEKEELWLATKQHWHIKEDPNGNIKKQMLLQANNAWRGFKKTLVKNYVRTGKNPLPIYKILPKEVWEEFRAQKLTPEFEEISRKARESANQNKDPARLGPLGYRGKIPEWEKEREKERELERESGVPVSLVHNVNNENAWNYLMGRRIKTATGSYELPTEFMTLASDLAEKDTKFFCDVREGRVLSDALGRPEHGGRTRGIGSTVGLKQAYASKKRKYRDKEEMEHEVARQVKETVRIVVPGVVREEVGTQLSMSSDIVGASGIRNNTCGLASPTLNVLDALESATPCFLMLPYGDKSKCARGLVYPLGDGQINRCPIENDYMKVLIDSVDQDFEGTPLPVRKTDMPTLGRALNSFVQWPKSAITLVQDYKKSAVSCDDHGPDETHSTQPLESPSTQPIKSPTMKVPTSNGGRKKQSNPQRLKSKSTLQLKTKCTPQIQPALSKQQEKELQTLARKPPALKRFFEKLFCRPNFREPIHVVSEAGVFEREFQFIIELDDMISLLTDGWLDVTIVTWFEMMLHSAMLQRRHNRCAFINAHTIQATSCDARSNDVVLNLAKVFQLHQDKDFFLAPYWQSKHWVLFVICPRIQSGFILDSCKSLNKNEKSYSFTNIVERAVMAYAYRDRNVQSRSMKWRLVECNQQRSTWECGYYVMKWMYDFTMVMQRDFPTAAKRLG